TAAVADNTGGSGIASVQFQISTNGGGTWANVGSPITTGSGGNYSLNLTSALADGSYQAREIVTDNAGNSSTSGAVTFTVDTIAPAVSSINRAGDTPTALSSVAFVVTFSEAVSG